MQDLRKKEDTWTWIWQWKILLVADEQMHVPDG